MRSGCGASRAGCQCRQRREQLLETLCRLELVPIGVAGGFFTGSPHRPSAGRPRCSRPSPGSGYPSPPVAGRSWKSPQVPGEGPLARSPVLWVPIGCFVREWPGSGPGRWVQARGPDSLRTQPPRPPGGVHGWDGGLPARDEDQSMSRSGMSKRSISLSDMASSSARC